MHTQHLRTRHSKRVCLLATATFFVLALSKPLLSQTLTVEPGCGLPGDSFTIGGSGWAEPNPICEYLFKFDGSEFAPRQPDGLFGPPNRNATVPSVSPGNHPVQVDLRLTEDGTLLQCRRIPFRVVATNRDPWAGGSNITPLQGFGLKGKFDPTDVCDVTPCKDIRIIQALQLSGQRADGQVRQLTAAGAGNPSASTLDNDTTPNGWMIDTLQSESEPYYMIQTSGAQGPPTSRPICSRMAQIFLTSTIRASVKIIPFHVFGHPTVLVLAVAHATRRQHLSGSSRPR